MAQVFLQLAVPPDLLTRIDVIAPPSKRQRNGWCIRALERAVTEVEAEAERGEQQ